MTEARGPVEALKAQHDELLAHLLREEPSLATGLSLTMAKALVLAGASEIEVDIQEHLVAYFSEVTNANTEALAFVTSQAIKRKYHTYFDWETPSAGPFFGMFGSDFKKAVAMRMKQDADFARHVKAFLDLGALRNQIIHKNFAVFSLDLTADEIFETYLRARSFCDDIPKLLRDTVAKQHKESK